jgi:AcrR family transcriptional regulator
MTGADRKAEIRKRASEVFAEQGFDRASIRDVAKAAEMSLAGLYYYYRGKEEILFDIQHEAFRSILERHAETLAGITEPEEKLRCVIDNHISFFAENIAEMKVMSRESDSLTGKFAEDVNEHKRRYVRLVKGIVEELGEKRGLKEIQTGVAVFVLFGMMNWMYTWYTPQLDGTAADISEAVLEIFLRGTLKPG